MSKIFELSAQVAELNNRAYFLDPDDTDDALELDEINKSLQVLAEQAENVADWLAKMIHEAAWTETQADNIAKHFAKKKKTATNRLEFFKQMALNFMVTHGIKESRGELFSISRSLTPGALQFDATFDPDLLPDAFVTVVPAVPEHKEAVKSVITASLRATIQTGTGKLDQVHYIATNPELPGVTLVRTDSLRIK